MPTPLSWWAFVARIYSVAPPVDVSGRSPIAQRASDLWGICASPRTLGLACLVWAALQLVSLAPHTANLNPALRFGAVLVAFCAVCFASELALRSGSGQLTAWRDVSKTVLVAEGRRPSGGPRAALWLSLAVWALLVTPAMVGYLEALPGSARGHLRVAEGEGGESFVMATPAPGTRRSLGAHALHVSTIERSNGAWSVNVQARRNDESVGATQTLPVGGRLLINDATIVFRGVQYEARVGGVVLNAELSDGTARELTLMPNRPIDVGGETLRLVRIESNVLGQLGAAALVTVQSGDADPQERWVYERAPAGFDGRHHEGVALTWTGALPVRSAVFAIRLGPAAWLQSMWIWGAWFAVTALLIGGFVRSNRGDTRFFGAVEAQ